MHTPSKRQQGLSLIELLISITIGLVILIAVATAYLNTTNMTRQRENLAELDDPAHNAVRMLKHDLTLAGYVDMFDLNPINANNARAASLFAPGPQSNMYIRAVGGTAPAIVSPISRFFDGLAPIFGCDGAMTSAPNTILTSPPPAAMACGTASATRHTLQIAYQGVPASAANLPNSLQPANAATGDGLDCLQQTPPAGQVMVVNRYSAPAVAAGAVSQMNCEGSGAAGAQPIASGVEEFVLRYQLAAPGDPLNPTAAGGGQQRYVNAAAVSDVANPQGWAGVTAVEICIVSATPVTSGAAAQGTVALQPTRPTCTRNADGVFDANLARAAGDNRLWKRYTAVVSLRNTVFATPF
ncbi:PilW family protein [Hydrogenophaga sp. BPS33]|uniref:PilW family protein n=1 Tax=Hydrogenophaga sp. BPS33 TaxID=2651974 RepID=UPI00135CD493|nr:PilW family protein [Hydrogenophaga sp. BPS33]